MEHLLSRIYKVQVIVSCKNFHTSFYRCGFKTNLRQTGNAIRKVMGATKKKNRQYNSTPTMPKPEVFSKDSLQGNRSGNTRRISVLNKLFMRYITDLLATSEISSQILGQGLEINRVQVAPDYKILNVYWVARSGTDINFVDNILQRSAGLLRHQLSQLRVMGVVPNIQFIKDKKFVQNLELDKRLAIADFGEDHVPSNWTEKLKTEFQIFSPLSEKEKIQLKKIDSEESDDIDLPLPPMPQNVLGLNHADILERIQKSMKKSAALHRQSNENIEENPATFQLTQTVNTEPFDLGSEKSQRAAFKKFLQQRQLQKLKVNREDKNYTPDLEYIQEEQRQREEQFLMKFEVDEGFQEDFILEETDETEHNS